MMSELVEQVRGKLPRLNALGMMGDAAHTSRAQDIIALVEADVRKRLLSGGSICPAADEIHAQYLNCDERYSVAKRVAEDAIRAGLKAIGIAEGADAQDERVGCPWREEER